MKKTLYTLGFLAFAALSVASCQKQPVPENEQEGKLVTVTFVAECPNTKSGILEEGTSSVSYKWTAEDEDNLKLFTVSGTTLSPVNISNINRTDTKLTFTATVADGSKVRAILAKTLGENNNPVVPSVQNPTTGSFDPNADILISEDEDIAEGILEEGLIFNRQVTINKMTLHNLGSNEKVRQVVITSDKDLTGDGKTLTLNYADEAIPESGLFPVYFVAMPNAEQNLTVDVVTDKKSYSKELTQPVSFTLGAFTKFNVLLFPPQFIKVTSSAELASGNYLIVYEEGNVAFNGALTTLDLASNTIPVTIEDGVIVATETADAAVFTIDISAGTIKSASGYYIGRDVSSNGFNSSLSTLYENTISIDSGDAVITGKGGCLLRFNATSGQTRFRYYVSGQQAIQLYKRVGPALPSVTWTLSSIEITTPPTKTEYTAGETFDPTGMVVTASYVDADNTSNTKTEEIALADLTISPSGALSTSDTEITVTYNGKTATQAINVSAYTVHTVVEAIAAAEGLGANETVENYYVGGIVCTTGSISSGAVSYYVSADGATTNRFEMYKGKYIEGTNFTAETNLKLGDYVVAKGTLTYYNSQAELASGNQVVSVFRAPVFSVEGGIYTEAQELTLTAEEGATIYYTLDGSTPTTESSTFTSAITIDEDMTVKVFATNGEFTSGVVTADYTINANASGTLENPFTVSELLDEYPSGSGSVEFYVTGTVSEVQEISASYGNASYKISDGTNTILVYRGKYLNNTSFTSQEQLSVNDEVVIYGKASVYNNALQMAQGNYLISINGKDKILTAPTVSTSIDDNAKTITVTWTAATGTEKTISYLVTCGTLTYSANAAGNHTFTMADYDTYDVSIVASAEDAVSVTVATTATLSDPNLNTPDPETIVFANLGLENGVQYTDPFDGGNFTITFGGGGNDGKYYTTGSGIRTYGGGTITIASSDYTIASIVFTWDGSNAPTSDVANPSGYDTTTKTWTGSSKSIVLTRPSNSGHWRLKSVKVTYK